MNERKQKSNFFNPVKEDEAGKQARKVIWSTKVLNLALQGVDKGKRLSANPFYENNVKLLKANLVFERTEEEIEEWKKCAGDILHFAHHCKLQTPEGIQHVELRPYQEKYLVHLVNHRMSIYLSCRQAGKTTTSAIFLLWFVLFNFDKNSLVLGNKGKTAKEILDKIKKIFYELPYYLRPGVEKWNEMEVVFDNGCRIMAETTTPRSGIGFSYHCILADEFAHVPANILDEFYENLLPTIVASKAQMIISSTQNGFNLFQRIYVGAVAGENEYSPFKTDWHEVPEWNPDRKCWEKRDEQWRQIQIGNYGGEDAFNRQFGTAFDSNANSLISNKKLKQIYHKTVTFVEKDLPGCQQYFLWHPDFEPVEGLKNGFFVITCDLAEGGGNDYTTYIINQVYLDKGVVKYKCVGMFHRNDINLETSAYWLRYICKTYMVYGRFYISIEMNTYGELFIRYLKDLIDSEPDYSRFNTDCFLRIRVEKKLNGKIKAEYKIGVKMDKKEKLYGCLTFKTKFESDIIENTNDLFINEAYNFCDEAGNNIYQASYGHDDIFMAQMQLVFFERTSAYNNIIESIKMGGTNENKFYNLYDQLSMGTGMILPPGFEDEQNHYGDEFERFRSRFFQ